MHIDKDIKYPKFLPIHVVKKHSTGFFHIGVFLLIYLSNLSYVTYGILTLTTNSNVFNGCQDVWVYNLIGIIYGASYIGKGAHTFTVSFKRSSSINDMTDINNSTYIDYVMIPILLIWGFYIQASISSDCLNIYYKGHKELWDLCQGTFYGILSMVLTFIGLEILTCFFNRRTDTQDNKYSTTLSNSLEPLNIFDNDLNIKLMN